MSWPFPLSVLTSAPSKPISQNRDENVPYPLSIPPAPPTSSTPRPPALTPTQPSPPAQSCIWEALPSYPARHTWGALRWAKSNEVPKSPGPYLFCLTSVLGVFSYLPQVFALLTAAESQSLVSARRSIGGLGWRLPAQRGLDGVEFGPRAAEL